MLSIRLTPFLIFILILFVLIISVIFSGDFSEGLITITPIPTINGQFQITPGAVFYDSVTGLPINTDNSVTTIIENGDLINVDDGSQIDLTKYSITKIDTNIEKKATTFILTGNTTGDSIKAVYASQKNVTTPPVTSRPVTSPPVTTPLVTTPPVTSRPVTTPPVTTPPVTTPPVTSRPVTNTPIPLSDIPSYVFTGVTNPPPIFIPTDIIQPQTQPGVYYLYNYFTSSQPASNATVTTPTSNTTVTTPASNTTVTTSPTSNESSNGGLNDFVNTVGKDANAVVNTVGKNANDVVNTVGKDANDVVNTVGKDANAILNTVGKDANAVVNTVGKDLNAVGNGIGKGINSLGSGYQQGRTGVQQGGSQQGGSQQGGSHQGSNSSKGALSYPYGNETGAQNPFTYNGALSDKPSSDFIPVTADFSKFSK